MADLNFAVFGTGFWSQFQIPAWLEIGGVKPVAAYNRTVAKAEKIASRFNIPGVYSDPEELFQNENLDFVDIITEVPAHAPLVFLAAKYKVPVICQKPMASDYATCREMVETCKAAGIPFMIHENFRWQAPLRALKGLLEQKVIGDPFRARIQFSHGLPFIFENQPMLTTLDQLALMDVGSHMLDLARFYFGEPDSLYCQFQRTRDDIKGEDVASVMLRIGEVICTCEMSYSSKTEWGHFPETFLFIEGTRGTIEVGPDYWIRVTTDQDTSARRFPPPRYAWADPNYDVVHASIVPCNLDLLQAIRDNVPAETSGEENLKTMRLVFAAYESARQNQVIDLSHWP